MRRVNSDPELVDWQQYAATQITLAEVQAGPTDLIARAEGMVIGLGPDLIRRTLFGASKRTLIQ